MAASTTPSTPSVPCKLRIKAPLNGGRIAMSSIKSNTKEEPLLAPGVIPTTLDESASGVLVFQSFQATDIAPRPKPELSLANVEPKEEPRLSKSKRRRVSRPEIISLDDDDEPVLVKKEEPLIQSSGRVLGNEVIVMESHEESAVTQPVLSPSNDTCGGQEQSDDSETVIVRRRRRSTSKILNREGQVSKGDAPPTESTDPQEGANLMKASLGNFLRVISCSAKGEGGYTNLLQTAQQTYEQAKRSKGKMKLQDSHPVRPSQLCVRRFSSDKAVEQTNGAQLLTEEARAPNPNTSTQPAFERDLPEAWFRESSRNGYQEIDNSPVDAPPPASRIGAEGEAQEELECTQRTIPECENEDDIMPANVTSGAVYTDAYANDSIAQRSAHRAERERLHTSQMEAFFNDEEGPTVSCRRDTVAKEELSAGCIDMRSNRTKENRRRNVRRKYWCVDPRRNFNGKRVRPGGKEASYDANEADATEDPVDRNGMSRGAVGEESDMDPDELELNRRPRQKRILDIHHKGERERNVRAQRRAGMAEGGKVHSSLMVDRKPVIEEQQRSVIIKVRESSGKTEYSFVKPHDEQFRDLREELELIVKLPPGVKFDLQYRKHAIRDRDTPESLGMLCTARICAKRVSRAEDDSSDSVTEVERKKRLENLLQVTVQDEHGKRHTFHHDKKAKFSSLFHAFAQLSKNDIWDYRFFYDGKRLSHDDRPADCEDFEDGALIDAFFETTGGNVVMAWKG